MNHKHDMEIIGEGGISIMKDKRTKKILKSKKMIVYRCKTCGLKKMYKKKD